MSPAAVIFRTHVQPSDRDAVRRIVQATEFFTPEETNVAVELIDEFLAKGAASGYQFVFAERGGEVLGYASFGHIAVTRHSYDLYWIAVDPRHQRGGLGRHLMHQAELQIARQGGRRVYVETSSRPQYAPTRAFYQRCGYQVDAVQEDFYAPGDGKVVFVKVLPAAEAGPNAISAATGNS